MSSCFTAVPPLLRLAVTLVHCVEIANLRIIDFHDLLSPLSDSGAGVGERRIAAVISAGEAV